MKPNFRSRFPNSFTALLLPFFLLLSSCFSLSAQQCCDVPGWQYVVEIDIDNTFPGNAAQTNYPVLLNIDTQTPIAAGHMDAAIGADIRFTDNTCGPFLDYWMETGFNTTNTQIWVVIPSLPANTVTTIFMYYGNPAATPVSNFNNVFTNILTVSGAQSLSGTQTYDWIDIQAGGTINLVQGQTLTLNARKVIMAGTINGNNCGFGAASGPGAGGNGGGSRGGGGGGYGGAGGSGGCPAGNSGPANGTPNGTDINMGSGGGGSDCNPNVGGGGAVTINATVVDLTGTINMNGGSMGGSCNEEAAGAGSGGGILIQTDYMNGTGAMNARGGNGQNSNDKEAGGGGGGGRIKIFYCSANNFTGTTNVTRGQPGNGDQCSADDAGNGTSTVNAGTCIAITYGPENPIRIVPVSDFTTADVCLGTDADFTDASTIPLPATIVSYDWDFGDGTPHSNQQNPSHTYLAAGVYNVILSVTSDEGCVDAHTSSITVNEIPTADFTFVNQCFGTAIPFTDASTINAPSVIAGWAWDFDGDLAPDDLTQNPTFNFPAAGNYTVGLGVQSDAGCVNAVTHNVTVYPNPVANFTAAAVCEGATTTFVNTSTRAPNAWIWDFGDASPAENTQNPTHVYAASNTYNVQLSVTTANGCTHDTTKAVDVNPIPVADFSGTDVCETAPSVFTDNSSVAAPATITNWEWDFDNNGSIDNTTQNPSYVFPVDGTHDALLTVTSTGGCTDDMLVTVTVFPGVVSDFTFTDVCLNVVTDFTDQSTVTSGIIVSWDWDFGDNTAHDNTQNTTHTYATDGTFTASLTVTSDNGCSSTSDEDVTVYPLPNADFSSTSVCEGEPSVFSDLSNVSSGSISTWRYEFGDNTISATQNPSHTYPAAGSYDTELLVTTAQGCLDSITKTVTVHPLPVVDFEVLPDNGCMPLDVDFNDLSTIATGNNVNWVWNIQSAGSINEQNTSHTFLIAGSYDVTLTVTSDMGCETTVTQTDALTVHPKPFPEFSFTPQITEILYPEITFTDLSSGNATQWNWQFGTGDSSDTQNPVYNFPDTGKFTVVLEIFNQFGCSDTVSHTVIITPSFTIYVPNAFSPNNDGVNDIFLPKGIGWRDYELRVFSRSGNQVFSSFDPLIGWNGKVRESETYAMPDVYVWRVYVRDKDNRIQDYVGTVTLVH